MKTILFFYKSQVISRTERVKNPFALRLSIQRAWVEFS